MAATGAMASNAALPGPLLASLGGPVEPLPPIQDPRVKELAQRGIDAARSAGASYADVRLLHMRYRGAAGTSVYDTESMVAGVRALVRGYWGFASSPVWSFDEIARLSREAVAQAMASTVGPTREVELAPVGVVPNGHWTMPVKIDPFTVSPDEIADYLGSLMIFTEQRIREMRLKRGMMSNNTAFVMQDKAFASTDNSYCTQRLFRSSGSFSFGVADPRSGREDGGSLECLTPAGMGWELFREQPLRAEIERELQIIREDIDLPIQPVDVGRYDVVFDASSVARLLSSTIGSATELDRALGFEANADGTSYITDPMTMLGTLKMGSPLLTVTANRSAAEQAATVSWDDEGVTPREFTLVKEGILTDFIGTRESAGWIKPGYARMNAPLTSRGCAHGGTDRLGGMYAPTAHIPNLLVHPGTQALDFDDCVAGLSKGVAFRKAYFYMDFQQLNGFGGGPKVYEIRDGKRAAIIQGAMVLVRAPELWSNLSALGGAASARRLGLMARKGEPPQDSYHSVVSVPAVIKHVTVGDYTRKA